MISKIILFFYELEYYQSRNQLVYSLGNCWYITKLKTEFLMLEKYECRSFTLCILKVTCLFYLRIASVGLPFYKQRLRFNKSFRTIIMLAWSTLILNVLEWYGAERKRTKIHVLWLDTCVRLLQLEKKIIFLNKLFVDAEYLFGCSFKQEYKFFNSGFFSFFLFADFQTSETRNKIFIFTLNCPHRFFQFFKLLILKRYYATM